MNRYQRDAFCCCRATMYQRVLNLLAPLLVLCSIVILLGFWKQIPDVIPTHYTFSGEVDGYGGKGTLWLMPAFGVAGEGMLFLLGCFPQWWNVNIPITERNRGAVYTALRDLMAEFHFCMALLFSTLSLPEQLLPRTMTLWVILALTTLMFVPVVRLLVRLNRIKKTMD